MEDSRVEKVDVSSFPLISECTYIQLFIFTRFSYYSVEFEQNAAI